MSSTPKESSQILLRQYTSVFCQPDTTKQISDPIQFFTEDGHQQTKTSLTDIKFTREDLVKAISELRTNSAAGSDGISAILLAKCKDSLALLLCIM